MASEVTAATEVIDSSVSIIPDDEHALNSEYTFWYHRRRGDKKNVDYNESTKLIETFGSIEQFWKIYDHIVRPNDFKVTTDYHLFKKGIKPTWEDPANNNGGKWMVRLKKGLASRYWEELILAIIGEQFGVGKEICGAVVSVRNSEDIISIWNRNSDNKDATNKIRDQMRRILKLPPFISVEYKKHVDAKADGSSFRNPSMVWKASPRNSDREKNEGGAFKSGGFHDKRSAGGGFREGKGENRGAGWKDRNNSDARNDRNSQSTGDPARDAANAERAKDERRGVSAAAAGDRPAWGNKAESPRPAWGGVRREGSTDTDSSSPREGGSLGGAFKRAPMPGIPPPLRSDGKKKEESNQNHWSRGV
jgi:translation initiation factor 4E